MHHPIDWIHIDMEKRVKDLLKEYFNIILVAHKHYGDNERFNYKKNLCIYNQVGALINDKGNNIAYNNAEISVIEININEEKKTCNILNAIYNKDNEIYEQKVNELQMLTESKDYSVMPVVAKYQNELEDSLKIDGANNIFNYYIFQPLVKKSFKDSNVDKISNIKEFDKRLFDDKAIEIVGAKYSGKTILAKRLFFYYKDEKKKFPLIISMKSINKSNYINCINNAINSTYGKNETEYLQVADEEKRIIIFDDVNKSNNEIYNAIMEKYRSVFKYIVSIRDKEFDENYLNNAYEFNGFYGESRNNFITKIVNNEFEDGNIDKEKLINRIIKIIKFNSSYIFRDPMFLRLFIIYIIKHYNIEKISFDDFYENIITEYLIGIMSKITAAKNIEKCIELLPIIANKMFEKNCNYIRSDELLGIIVDYINNTYNGMKIEAIDILNQLLDSCILMNNEDDIYFKNERFLSIFIAKYLIEHNNYNAIKELFNSPYGISYDVIENTLVLTCKKSESEINKIKEIFFDCEKNFIRGENINFNASNHSTLKTNYKPSEDFSEAKSEMKHANETFDNTIDEMLVLNSYDIIAKRKIIESKSDKILYTFNVLFLEAKFLNLSRKFLNDKKSVVKSIYKYIMVLSNILHIEAMKDEKMQEAFKALSEKISLNLNFSELIKSIIYFSNIEVFLLNLYRYDMGNILSDYEFITDEEKIIEFLIKILYDDNNRVMELFKYLYSNCNNEIKSVIKSKILLYVGNTANMTEEQYREICFMIYGKKDNTTARVANFLKDKFKNINLQKD